MTRARKTGPVVPKPKKGLEIRAVFFTSSTTPDALARYLAEITRIVVAEGRPPPVIVQRDASMVVVFG